MSHPGAWTVLATRPDRRSLISEAFSKKVDAEKKAEELRSDGYIDVEVKKSEMPRNT